eukprot:CAMPEP_0118857026 /NCGR_PEP_ID=MMETSP1163-20130328/4282_1 /TAXON_ID=124430 /ORGANISM="Phaeomonas parva, Strain CCMP2877" /LENGTH=195 /DNA_ID=CAMNT_0006790271 /DNA_START=277 /DNA_END=864 /DNA_ORIENTATION=-
MLRSGLSAAGRAARAPAARGFHATRMEHYRPRARWWKRGYEGLSWKEKGELAKQDETLRAAAAAARASSEHLDVPIGVLIDADEYPHVKTWAEKDAITDLDEISRAIEAAHEADLAKTEAGAAAEERRRQRKAAARWKLQRKRVQADLLFGPQPHQDATQRRSRRDTEPAYKIARKPRPEHRNSFPKVAYKIERR